MAYAQSILKPLFSRHKLPVYHKAPQAFTAIRMIRKPVNRPGILAKTCLISIIPPIRKEIHNDPFFLFYRQYPSVIEALESPVNYNRKGEESNLPRPGTPAANGFEGRRGHQTPSSSGNIIVIAIRRIKTKWIWDTPNIAFGEILRTRWPALSLATGGRISTKKIAIKNQISRFCFDSDKTTREKLADKVCYCKSRWCNHRATISVSR